MLAIQSFWSLIICHGLEGFYVRFFWDWLAFISGAFRW
ncbi:hypothetical protein EC970007_4479, partial [Escherichia coli 97.0007]